MDKLSASSYETSIKGYVEAWTQKTEQAKTPKEFQAAHQSLINNLNQSLGADATREIAKRLVDAHTTHPILRRHGFSTVVKAAAQSSSDGKIRSIETPEPSSTWQKFLGAGKKITQKLRDTVFPKLAQMLPIHTLVANTASLITTQLLSTVGILKKPMTLTGLLDIKKTKYEPTPGNLEDIQRVDEMAEAARASIGGFDNRQDTVPGYLNIGKLLAKDPTDVDTLLKDSHFEGFSGDKLRDIRTAISQHLPDYLKQLVNKRGFFEDKSCGFHASLFMNTDGRIFVSYEGSEISISDPGRIITTWGSNAAQIWGANTPIYKRAADLAIALQKAQGDKVVLTGHSLGGGLASHAGKATFEADGKGLRTYALNPSSKSDLSKGGNANLMCDNVYVVRVKGDALTGKVEKSRYKLFPVGFIGYDFKLPVAEEDEKKGMIERHNTQVVLRALEAKIKILKESA